MCQGSRGGQGAGVRGGGRGGRRWYAVDSRPVPNGLGGQGRGQFPSLESDHMSNIGKGQVGVYYFKGSSWRSLQS